MINKSKRCSQCILSSSFPGIQFDEKDVCNFCRNEIIATTEDKIIESAKERIHKLFSSNKGTTGYDAIMCYSGGKDSTYTLKLAIEKYGLKILSFTLDNGFISPAAFENINNVLDYLGVDHYTFRPSSKFMTSLIKASVLNEIYNPNTLKRISAVCNSCISIINITALKLSLQMNIPIILSGFTLGQIPANAIMYQNNYNFLKESREVHLKKLRKLVGNSIDQYLGIDDTILNKVASYPFIINLLCLEDISENEIVDEVKTMGWKAPTDVDGCSSNCRLNTFNNYVHQQTFGYSPYELELSHLIRKRKLSREEALKKINDQPLEQLDSIMNQLKIDKNDLLKLNEIYNRQINEHSR